MKKIILSLVSATILSFFCHLEAQQIPDQIIFKTQDGYKHVAHKGQDNFDAAFFYLQFIEKLDAIQRLEEYQPVEERIVHATKKAIDTSIGKIKIILTYGNQIDFLKEEIDEAIDNNFTQYYEYSETDALNIMIKQFHPVKALNLKCKILKGVLATGTVLLAGYMVFKNVFRQPNKVQKAFPQMHINQEKSFEEERTERQQHLRHRQ